MNQSATLTPDPASDFSEADDALLKPFDSAPIQGDQRQSYRYPAQTGREEATIRRGGKTFPAKLVEESAGGIALEVSKDLKLTALEQIEVGIYSGWYVARVIHMRPIENGQRVGLQRIVAISTDSGETRGKRNTSNTGNGIGKFATFFVGAAALLAGIGLTTCFEDFFSSKSKSSVAVSNAKFIDTPSGEKIKRMFDSVNILTKPEIATKLKLTPEQKSTFEGVLVGASNRLGAAYEESKNAPPEVWYAKSQGIINEALENILCSMTDRQIVQWRRVLLEKRKGIRAEERVGGQASTARAGTSR